MYVCTFNTSILFHLEVQLKSGLGHLSVEVSRSHAIRHRNSHTYTHDQQGSSERMITWS